MNLTSLALLFITIVALTITSVQTVLTLLFRRRGRFFVPGPRFRRADSFVSILKPVCGLDDELQQNLESFTRVRGVDYEVVVSVADPDDPALEVVERVRRAHPRTAIRIVIGGDPRLEDGNRKVARLIAAARQAKGDILLISDSNVHTEADDLLQTLAMFDDPRIGCVSNLFTGAHASSFGARIETLHLLGFVVPGCVIAAFGRVPCVVGKSMAITREALDAIGGFERFARVLAEDQAIGLAVKEAGFDVALSPVVVRNIVVKRTLKRALDRQIRWNKIRYAFSKASYASEFLVNPLPFAILTFHPAVMIAAALLRIAQMALLGLATNAPLTWRELALVPLQDLLQFGAQFVPYFDDTVTWRGYRLRIGPNTELVEAIAA
jgi:ceramide glucosyltransferase